MNCPKPFLRDLIHLFTSKSRRFAFTFWPIQGPFFSVSRFIFLIILYFSSETTSCGRHVGSWDPGPPATRGRASFYTQPHTRTILRVLFDLFFCTLYHQVWRVPRPSEGEGKGSEVGRNPPRKSKRSPSVAVASASLVGAMAAAALLLASSVFIYTGIQCGKGGGRYMDEQ